MVKIRDISVSYEDLPQGLREAVDYWRTLKGQRIGPKWREIDMLKLPLQLLPTTVVVDCFDDEQGANFRYRFYGSGLRSIHNVELTGKTPDDVPVSMLSKSIKDEFIRVENSKAPLFSVYGADTAKGFSPLFERCAVALIRRWRAGDKHSRRHQLSPTRYGARRYVRAAAQRRSGDLMRLRLNGVCR